jgi:hypothetical protein
MSLTYTTAESIEDYVTCLRGTFITGKKKILLCAHKKVNELTQ